ncbi:MAG: NADPH:quinone reductase-like Zn-dependent oxidoreductase [Acidimicrobiales bacterium]|jgi:NADPH:quinone reductase-like Zn-dependent oxidoreductase
MTNHAIADDTSTGASPTAIIQEAKTMKAIVHDTYGEADVLQLRDIPTPTVGDDDVLVQVNAAGVDAGVWHLMTGLPYAVRIAGYGVRAPKHQVRGMDLAGTVEAVGKNVTRFQVGDAVFGTADGSYAEYVTTTEDKLATKPTNLTFEQAAAVPTSAFTALEAVRDRGEVAPGQQVLVIGASGGVGTFAVQIAKALGAEVTGVASGTKLEMVCSIGADHVIDYKLQDFTGLGHRYDVIIDTGGLRSISSLRRALTPTGTLVIVGGEGGNKWTGGAGRGLRAIALSPFVKHNLRNFIAANKTEDLWTLKDLIEAGDLTPVIDKSFPLNEVSDAIRYMTDGRAAGKLVVTI